VDRAAADHAFVRPADRASRRAIAYSVIAIATMLPRLVALLYERGAILPGFTLGEKSDDIARTFLDSGTFGLIPGLPTAYTQPLYSFFLIPLYETLGRSWPVVGGAQIVVATATACVVFEIGRRFLSGWAGLVAALLTALHPYSIWHDVHVNREILDCLLAASMFFFALALASRRSLALAGTLGAVLGLAILGNVRLAALPLVLAIFLLWNWRPSWRALGAVAVIFTVCLLVLIPWVARNRLEVGCLTLTTDARALWEANNERTLDILKSGLWIDNVPLPPAFPPSPQDAGREYRRHGRIVPVRECREATFYRNKVLAFWREHPEEKVRLALQATLMLWNPKVSPIDSGDMQTSGLNRIRAYIEPIYMTPVFLLALLGLAYVPRRLAALAVTLLAYQWALAVVFVGATRYRVPWDYIVALLAAAALVEIAARLTGRSGAPNGQTAGRRRRVRVTSE
jgi:4-amino-4-deoxy-L-arabinose transferase-like glycosyltransferase